MKNPILLFILIGLFMYSCKKDETVAPVAVAKSSEKLIKTFNIDNLGVSGVIDASSKIITLTLPEVANLSSLSPTISGSDKATISPASGTAQDFTKDVNYVVTAEDGTSQSYTVKTVVKKSCKIVKYETNDGVLNNYEYDSKGNLITFTFLKNGAVQYTEKYKYNDNGYPTQKDRQVSVPTYGLSYTTVYTYTNNQRTESIQTNSQGAVFIVDYVYDASGNLTKLTNSAGQIYNYTNATLTSMVSPDFSISLNSQGYITKELYKPDSSYNLYTYNDKGLLIKAQSYDNKGNLTNYFNYEYSDIKVNQDVIYSYNKGLTIVPNVRGSQAYYVTKNEGISVDPNTKKETIYYTAIYSYTFDSKGKVLTQTINTNGKSTSIGTYTYKDCD